MSNNRQAQRARNVHTKFCPCGEPAVKLVGLDLDQVAGTQTDQGLTWKESVTVTVQRRQDAQFDVLSVESGSPE